MKTSLVVGSRESALALAQTNFVMETIQQRHPELVIEVKTFKTLGDRFLDAALNQLGGKGLFVKELEEALLKGEIDFAVHSMKDMPAEAPEGLAMLPFGQREAPRDALVSKTGKDFTSLPYGAIVGTSSLRRQAVLLHKRPDLQCDIVRGNVQTRLKKLEEGPFDALVLAEAGLRRLNLTHVITGVFSPEEMLPACCQGTLCIELRAGDELEALFNTFIDEETAIATTAERAFLKTIQGGCQVPMAAYAHRLDDGRYRMRAMLADPTGASLIEDECAFSSDEAEAAGAAVAQNLLNRGGHSILAQLLPADVDIES